MFSMSRRKKLKGLSSSAATVPGKKNKLPDLEPPYLGKINRKDLN